jgi:hypothetical protein
MVPLRVDMISNVFFWPVARSPKLLNLVKRAHYLPFAFVGLTRASRNSSRPLIKRRFQLAFASSSGRQDGLEADTLAQPAVISLGM